MRVGVEMAVVGDLDSLPAHLLRIARTSHIRNLHRQIVVAGALVDSGRAWQQAVQRVTSLPIEVSRGRGQGLLGRAELIFRKMILGQDHRQEEEEVEVVVVLVVR